MIPPTNKHIAFLAKGFHWNHPEYEDEGYQEEADIDDTADAVSSVHLASCTTTVLLTLLQFPMLLTQGSDIEDVIEGGEEDEEVLYTEMVHIAPESSKLDESLKGILESNLDPLLWQTELERVGPRLKVSAQDR